MFFLLFVLAFIIFLIVRKLRSYLMQNLQSFFDNLNLLLFDLEWIRASTQNLWILISNKMNCVELSHQNQFVYFYFYKIKYLLFSSHCTYSKTIILTYPINEVPLHFIALKQRTIHYLFSLLFIVINDYNICNGC